MRTPQAATLAVCLLAVLAQYTSAETPGGCREYYSKGHRAPAVDSLSDTITVPDAFPVGEATVSVDLSHRRIGALVVHLSAKPPQESGANAASRSVVLKERGLGRLGDNMYMTTFSDAATASFPVEAEAAPFRGAFKPTQRLSFLYEDANANSLNAASGGSKGDWVLRVDDVAPNATIRPIALNGWMLRLCPATFTSTPNPSTPSTPVPSTNTPQQVTTTPTPTPTPVPTTPPPVNGFQGPPAPQQPRGSSLPGGWQLVFNNDGTLNQGTQDSISQGVQAMDGPIVPPINPGGAGMMMPPINPNDPFGVQNFQSTFNAYLKGRFGPACTDDACSNIKAKFWKAALGVVYLKAKHDGKLPAGAIAEKIAALIPGPNPLLGKLGNVTKDWAAKKGELLENWSTNKGEIIEQLSSWYDKLQQYMNGNMDGLGALLSNVMGEGGMSSEGLRSLGIDPSVAMSALGPMLGLDNPEDTKALMEGLSEAGFQEMMAEFLMPAR